MEIESIFITLHVTTLLITAVVIVYADHRALAYFRGKEPILPRGFIVWSHRLVFLGLLGMIISGVFLVLPAWEVYLQDPTWYAKMGLVGVLFFNALAIGKLAAVASERPFAALSKTERQTLLFSGGLSAVGWVGAALIGVFFL